MARLTALTSTLTLWRRSLTLLWEAAPAPVATLVALMLVQAALPAATLWASRSVVDAAARTLSSGAQTDVRLDLAFWIGLAVALIVVQQGLAPLFQAAQEAAGDRLTVHVNGAVLTAANRWRGLARFEDPTFANHLAVAREQAARGPLYLLVETGRVLQSVLSLLAMSMLLWRLHPLAPVLVILAYVPLALLENHFAQMMSNTLRTARPEGRKLDSYFNAVLDVAPAKDVRLYALGGFFGRLYGAGYRQLRQQLWTLRRGLMLRMLPAQALAAGVAAIVYLYAVHQAFAGAVTLGDLVLFAGALLQMQAALAAIAFEGAFMIQDSTWLPSLFAILDAGPDLALPAQPFLAPRPFATGLVLDHVSFRYPDTERWVLRDVSFTIRPDERLALVGRNGAGKTTLVKLLCRFYDPTEGRIVLDGTDLREYDIDELRRQVAAVFQDFVRFEFTAQENVGCGDVSRLGDLARVQAAARAGGAEALMASLPNGYDTRLGSRFGGVQLSGGQWQIIALSRAFMRDAKLLILDEPTAALDVQAEYDVYRRFAELTRDRTTILVSHRFSTVRMADHIVYLEDGRLIEEGSHDDLMGRDGGYAHLYRLQADLYK